MGWDGMGWEWEWDGMGMGWEWEWEWVDGDREREVVGGGVYVCGMGDELVTATAVWPHGKANQGSAYRKGRRGPLPATTIAPAMPAANRNAATVVSPDGRAAPVNQWLHHERLRLGGARSRAGGQVASRFESLGYLAHRGPGTWAQF